MLRKKYESYKILQMLQIIYFNIHTFKPTNLHSQMDGPIYVPIILDICDTLNTYASIMENRTGSDSARTLNIFPVLVCITFEPEVVLVAQGDGRELDGRYIVDLDVRHGVVRVVSQHTHRHLLREVSQDSQAHQHPEDSGKQI